MRRYLPLSFVILAVVVTVSAQAPAPVSPASTPAKAASTSAPQRSINLPEFEVDKAWPKVPPKWKLGDASSFAIDAKDNVWLLHRPRTLKPGDAAMAAPPVVVFDTAGAFVKAWGSEDAGTQWPEREHGIHVDAKGFVWITGNNCPTNGIAGLKPVNDDQILKLTGDGKVAMRIGDSNGSTIRIKVRMGPAPSILALSIISSGMPCSPLSSTIKRRPEFIQIVISETEINAEPESVSHCTGDSPSCSRP